MEKKTMAALVAETRSEFVAAIPALGGMTGHPGLAEAATVVALSRCTLSAHLRPSSVWPRISCRPAAGRGRRLRHAVSAIETSVGRDFRSTRHPGARPFFDEAPIVALSTLLMVKTGGADASHLLFETVSKAIMTINAAVDGMTRRHRERVLLRDAGEHGVEYVGNTVKWALAIDVDGQPHRDEAVARRFQALKAYGAIGDVIMLPAIAAEVDAGRELVPALCAHFAIDKAKLRHVNGRATLAKTLRNHDDLSSVVVELAAFDVPAHRWSALLDSRTWGRGATDIVPPDVMDQQARDALQALRQDVLRPLVAERMAALGIRSRNTLVGFASSLELSKDGDPIRRRAWLRATTAAILGSRGAKSFAEGVGVWHRRAASLAALRHENSGGDEKPGWPALCRTWTSADGRAQVVPLTTAAALVEEGNSVDHCVGGYYDHCMSGNTHILSLRIDGRNAATIEFVSRVVDDRLVLKPGQFKSHGNRDPNAVMQRYYEDFRRALTAGDHRVARKAVVAHAQGQAGASSHRSTQVDMTHAEASWPLYRALLPRPWHDGPRRWAEATGLRHAIDVVLVEKCRGDAEAWREAIANGVLDKAAPEVLAEAGVETPPADELRRAA